MRGALLTAVGIIALALGGVFAYREFSGKVNFTLQSSHGPVSLSEYRGKDVVVYFGFSSCPYVCPMALSRLTKLLAKLPPEKQAKIVPVFVSVDYRGDTPQKVGAYFQSFFKDRGVGLTGSKEELDRAVAPFQVNYAIQENKELPAGYTIIHPDAYYLVDSSGRLVGSVPLESRNELILAAFSALN